MKPKKENNWRFLNMNFILIGENSQLSQRPISISNEVDGLAKWALQI